MWNQDSRWGTAQSGTYVIGFGGAETESFVITHDNPAFYEPDTVEGEALELLVEKQRYWHGERVRSALVNTGTEPVVLGSSISAWVVDGTGTTIDKLEYVQWDDIIEPGERLQGAWDQRWRDPHDGNFKEVSAGEYHIVIPNGTRSVPFVIG